MIIVMRKNVTEQEKFALHSCIEHLAGQPCFTEVCHGDREMLVLSCLSLESRSQDLLTYQSAVERIIAISTPYQLVSRDFQKEDTQVKIGDIFQTIPIWIGNTTSPVIMAGPCSVESREQIVQTACEVKQAGAHILRGGVFKPRTSPYQFQGLGVEGLQLLAEARQQSGLPVITEVMEPALVDITAEYVDILQIGSRNMQNYPLLKAVGKDSRKRPVLLKRGLWATIEEWLLAAEYILAAGNPHVILCERGIRSYDPSTRNVLDLACIPLLRQITHLPVVVDPSHATGRADLVPAMSLAALAAGAHGLLIEVHCDPTHARSDGKQSITPRQLASITGNNTYSRQMSDARLPEMVSKRREG